MKHQLNNPPNTIFRAVSYYSRIRGDLFFQKRGLTLRCRGIWIIVSEKGGVRNKRRGGFKDGPDFGLNSSTLLHSFIDSEHKQKGRSHGTSRIQWYSRVSRWLRPTWASRPQWNPGPSWYFSDRRRSHAVQLSREKRQRSQHWNLRFDRRLSKWTECRSRLKVFNLAIIPRARANLSPDRWIVWKSSS